VPNDIGAGMVTNRLVIYFWLFAFVIIKKQIQFKPGSIVVSLVIFLGFFIIQNKAYNTHIKKYAQVGYEFYEIGAFIPSGKTVWSINFSEEWFVGHSSNYASIPNKSIAIENYEANNAWFPIVWDDHFQKEGNLYATYYHLDSIESFVAIPSDYLLIYGEPNEDFQNSLAMSATLIHEKNEIQLYQLKK
jgi:hypothetical protein